MAGNAVTRGVPRQLLQGNNPSVPIINAGQIPTINYSTGSARALQQFSRDMFQLSSTYEDQLDAQVQAEAKTQGAVAGVSGDIELQDYGTIRGRSYNQAAIETFAATVETKSIIQLQELQAKFANDPDALKAGIENWTKGAVSEISKFDPAAGVALQQRMIVRGAPAVEAAKDAAYKLTKDQADAALIENEVALKAEVKSNAADLFSENPDRSRAAARAIGMVQNEYMKIYTAKDPVTGRPLYSAEEIAKAKKTFGATVMNDATLAWFDGQKDKAGAYMKFTSGDFKIKLNSVGGTAKVKMANSGSTRNDPLKPELQQQLSAAASAVGDGIDVVVHSGGQETHEEVAAGIGNRTGSPRHDHGGAGDMRLSRDGKILPFNENRDLYLKFAESLAAAGVTGIGVDEAKGYIHGGGGSQASWGYKGKSAKHAFLPSDFNAAIERGRAGEKIEYKPSTSEFSVRDSLPAATLESLESEMRSRITFSNQMIDRRDKEAKDELDARQNLNEFEMSARIFATGAPDPETGQPPPPLSQTDILAAVRSGLIDPGKGSLLAKALAVEKPNRSDPETLRDLNARLYAGEDVYTDVLRAANKLTPDDAAQLMGKNQTQNRGGEDDLTKDQKFLLGNLDKLLTPRAGDGKWDEGREERRFFALDEFRRRVRDPNETMQPREIMLEIADRATADKVSQDMSELGRRIWPRFAVQAPQGGNRIDARASAVALNAAYQSKKITEATFKSEMAALLEWNKIQISVMAEEEKIKAKRAK